MQSENLKQLIEENLKLNKSISEIKEDLLLKGFAEEDINKTINAISLSLEGSNYFKRNYILMKRKFFLDKAGFGFSSNQFINILFFLTGANLLIVGIFNILKVGLSNILSAIFQEYSKKSNINKYIINISGVLFGFSFLFIAFAVLTHSITLFSISMLVGAVGVVVYGDLFKRFQNDSVGANKKVLISSGLAFLGLLITFIAMIISGLLMDLTSLEGKLFSINIFGILINLKLEGYLVAFEITAIIFILSSFMLSKMNFKKTTESMKFKEFINYYYNLLLRRSKIFFKNKRLFVLSLTTLFFAIFQSIIYSFAGIYIFNNLAGIWFGKFVDISIIFGIPLVLSIFGPLIAFKLNKYLGLSPLLVFGALLVAIFPLTLAYNSFLPAILLANILSILGAAIIGTSQSILASRLLNELERNLFYKYLSVMLAIPFIILSLLFLILGQNLDFVDFFKICGIGLIVFLVPPYLLLVVWSKKLDTANS